MAKTGFIKIKWFILGLITTAIVLSAALKLNSSKFGKQNSNLHYDFFPVYGYDRNLEYEQINYYVRIPESIPLLDKIKILADGTSRFSFGGRNLEVLKIVIKDGKKVAVINLQEDKHFVDLKKSDEALYRLSWVGGTFQGSTGGIVTGFTLLETFLQPEYQGQWIDGLEILYNGQKIVGSHNRWQHIDLSESPYFNNPFKQAPSK